MGRKMVSSTPVLRIIFYKQKASYDTFLLFLCSIQDGWLATYGFSFFVDALYTSLYLGVTMESNLKEMLFSLSSLVCTYFSLLLCVLPV